MHFSKRDCPLSADYNSLSNCSICFCIWCLCMGAQNWTTLKVSAASLFACLLYCSSQKELLRDVCATRRDFMTHFPRGVLWHITQTRASWTSAISLFTGTSLVVAERGHWSCRHHICLWSISYLMHSSCELDQDDIIYSLYYATDVSYCISDMSHSN